MSARVNAKPARRFLSRAALALGGLLFGLLLIELGLRAAGAVLAGKEAAPGWTRAPVRVLCLGESTTAPNEHAWPLQLQRLLDLRLGPGRVAVINAGRGSTTSGILLSRLPELLDFYRPGIVVAMMGVNDSRWFGVYEENRNAGTRLHRLLARLRLFKLGEYAYREIWRRSGAAWPEAAEVRLVDQADALGRRGRNEVQRAILSQVFASSRNDRSISGAGVRLVDASSSAMSREKASSIYGRIAAIERRHDGLGGGFLEPAPRFGAVPDAAGRVSAVTAENYRRLGKALAARGVALAVMQYPTRPISEIEKAASFPPGTVFIENRTNFAAALKTRAYAELFVDRFGGDWGHCTAEGDRLIAESAYRGLRAAGLLEDPACGGAGASRSSCGSRAEGRR